MKYTNRLALSAALFTGSVTANINASAALLPYKPMVFVDTLTNTPAVVKKGDFSIAVLPDTQFYVAQAQLGGNFDMFKAQIEWIKKNQVKENIAYVAHMGDITEHADNPVTQEAEWYLAKTALYGLESPISIPYGLTIGNHDQFPVGYPVKGTTSNYNKYFGVKHFEGRPYYGGHYGDSNDSHFDKFTAGGLDFIVIFLEFDSHNEDQTNLYAWANNVLKDNATRKAIVVSHSMINVNPVKGDNTKPAPFNAEGKAIYESLKNNPNLFMMLCGHVSGEGYRTDIVNGHTIKTFLNDYQGRPNGGNGLMRLYKFSVKNNQISVRTFSPYAKVNENDADSQFTVPLFD